MLDNFIILLVLTVVCVILLYIFLPKANKLQRVGMTISTIIMALYTVLSGAYLFKKYSANAFIILFTIVCALAILIFIVCLPLKPSEDKLSLIVTLFSIAATIAPLFAVTPIGERCFFGSYVLFMLLIAQLISLIAKNTKNEKAFSVLTKSFIVPCVAGALYLFSVFSAVYSVDQARIEKAQLECQTNSTIYVSDLPHDDYIWVSSVKEKIWSERFKLFYGIPEDVTVIATEYQK